MAESHMYQQDMVSKDISSYVLIITIYIYIYILIVPQWNKYTMKFLFNVLNFYFSTTTKKTIWVDVQMKVKNMMREKYLLKSCSRNRKREKKEEEGNGQNI